MSRAITHTGDQIANALRTLGVHFILGRQSDDGALYKHPALLIAALAKSHEARLRLSLIPLFLEYPEFAAHVREVAKNLEPTARLTLQCYYSAAIWIGRKYQPRSRPLPDYFSKELNLIPSDHPDQNLAALAKRHEELSGAHVNWLGTYLHAAQVWLKGLEYKKA